MFEAIPWSARRRLVSAPILALLVWSVGCGPVPEDSYELDGLDEPCDGNENLTGRAFLDEHEDEEWTTRIVHRKDQAISTLHLTLSYTGEPIVCHRAEREPPSRANLQVPVEIRVRTEDGRFDEAIVGRAFWERGPTRLSGRTEEGRLGGSYAFDTYDSELQKTLQIRTTLLHDANDTHGEFNSLVRENNGAETYRPIASWHDGSHDLEYPQEPCDGDESLTAAAFRRAVKPDHSVEMVYRRDGLSPTQIDVAIVKGTYGGDQKKGEFETVRCEILDGDAAATAEVQFTVETADGRFDETMYGKARLLPDSRLELEADVEYDDLRGSYDFDARNPGKTMLALRGEVGPRDESFSGELDYVTWGDVPDAGDGPYVARWPAGE